MTGLFCTFTIAVNNRVAGIYKSIVSDMPNLISGHFQLPYLLMDFVILTL
jgi:hypothetical protein